MRCDHCARDFEWEELVKVDRRKSVYVCLDCADELIETCPDCHGIGEMVVRRRFPLIKISSGKVQRFKWEKPLEFYLDFRLVVCKKIVCPTCQGSGNLLMKGGEK